MSNFTLLTSREYLKDVTSEIRKAQKRVHSLTLIITQDSETKGLVKAIKKAAKRGIATNIVIDAFTYSELGGAFSPRKKQATPSRATTNMLLDFANVGAKTYVLNNGVKLNPFSGVTHIKWFVIDDIVYCFGGTNLYKKGIQSTDYMFKVRDKKLADTLVHEQEKIVACDKNKTEYAGLRIKFPFGDLLIDSGKKNDSFIYKRACELAAQSKEVLFVSQYCPTGKLVNYLKNTPSKIYFNPPKIAADINGKLLIKSSMLRTNLKTIYKKDTYIHAKFIIFTLKDDTKIAITGSHNFAYSGVKLGTKEVALETADEKIVAQLETFHKKYVA
ncbi:phosphatidylserine/phosphatidylglycerophosphate/cardiolipin synthase family protein [Candidatus Saccharibacteria bacterium]|nr:phosphatidylserine/phosphatidylglycerophosphate/cardiolipin synthase family protein [Candidatus Saccharibacteria bacterium]